MTSGLSATADLSQSLSRLDISDSATSNDFSCGTRVWLHGLTSRPHLNGRGGICLGRDGTQRVGVVLDGEKKPLAIKPINLTLTCPDTTVPDILADDDVVMSILSQTDVTTLLAAKAVCSTWQSTAHAILSAPEYLAIRHDLVALIHAKVPAATIRARLAMYPAEASQLTKVVDGQPSRVTWECRLPLHHAIMLEPEFDVVEALVEAFPEACDQPEPWRWKRYPVQVAVQSCRPDLVRLLLEVAPQSARGLCKEGKLPLHYAVSEPDPVLERRFRPGKLARRDMLSLEDGEAADWVDCVRQLVAAWPEAATVGERTTGRWPLQIALDDHEKYGDYPYEIVLELQRVTPVDAFGQPIGAPERRQPPRSAFKMSKADCRKLDRFRAQGIRLRYLAAGGSGENSEGELMNDLLQEEDEELA